MIGQLRHTVTLGTDVFGNLQRMDNALEGLPIKEQACREQLSNLQTQLETAKAEVQKPFPILKRSEICCAFTNEYDCN